MPDRTKPRWKTTKWHGRDNYECTRCGYKTLDRGLMVRHAQSSHPLASEGAEHELAGVNFASDAALDLALKSGLSRDAMTAHTATGKTGGYTVADVRSAAARTNQED